jgi:E3 ubiquitin-protein ligase makorin
MGHCSKGSACTFSHDIEPKGAVCQFFLQGNCRFGTYCQLSHVKPKKQTQSTSKLKTSTAVKPVQIKSQKIIVNKYQNETELGLCPFHITEKCNANACKYIHGLQCPVCKKNVLDPRKPSTHDEHVISCTKNKEQESRSKEKECVVCFEIVKEKKDPRFGLLACEHCVCLTCIRSWRDISSVDTSKVFLF